MVEVGDIFKAPEFYQGKYYQVTHVYSYPSGYTTAHMVPVRKGDLQPYNRPGGIQIKEVEDGALPWGWVPIKTGGQ